MPLSVADRSTLYIGRSKEGNVSIICSNPSLAIHYAIDESEPTASSMLYTGPFALPDGGTVKAFAYINGGDCQSSVTTAVFGISRLGWRVVSVSLESEYANGGSAGVDKLLDDDPETYWHTYHVDKSKSAAPHDVVLDMGEVATVEAFTFMPRLFDLGGTPDRCEFYLSPDGKTWVQAATARFDDLVERPSMRLVPLNKPSAARYIRFVATHTLDDADFVAVAGIGVLTVAQVSQGVDL